MTTMVQVGHLNCDDGIELIEAIALHCWGETTENGSPVMKGTSTDWWHVIRDMNRRGLIKISVKQNAVSAERVFIDPDLSEYVDLHAFDVVTPVLKTSDGKLLFAPRVHLLPNTVLSEVVNVADQRLTPSVSASSYTYDLKKRGEPGKLVRKYLERLPAGTSRKGMGAARMIVKFAIEDGHSELESALRNIEQRRLVNRALDRA